MAAPSYQVSAGVRASSDGNTTFSPQWPATASAGDVGLFIVYWVTSNSYSGTPGWCTMDSGFAELSDMRLDEERSGYHLRVQWFWKRHSGSESNPTVTLPYADTSTEIFRSQPYLFSGCDSSGTPFGPGVVTSEPGSSGTTAYSVPAGEGAVTNDTLSWTYVCWNRIGTAGTATISSGWTECGDVNHSAGDLGFQLYEATYDTTLNTGDNSPAATITWTQAPTDTSTVAKFVFQICANSPPTGTAWPVSGEGYFGIYGTMDAYRGVTISGVGYLDAYGTMEAAAQHKLVGVGYLDAYGTLIASASHPMAGYGWLGLFGTMTMSQGWAISGAGYLDAYGTCSITSNGSLSLSGAGFWDAYGTCGIKATYGLVGEGYLGIYGDMFFVNPVGIIAAGYFGMHGDMLIPYHVCPPGSPSHNVITRGTGALAIYGTCAIDIA